MNEFACTLITSIVLLAFILRGQYINVICEDWNIKVDLYLDRLNEEKRMNSEKDESFIYYVYRKRIIPMSYWFSLHKWSVRSIVKDDDLIETVNNHVMMLSK